MANVDFKQQLEVEIGRLARVPVETYQMPIPHIDGWTVQTVLGHTGWVFRYIANALEASPDSPPRRSSVGEPPVGDELLPWFLEGAELVQNSLASGDPEALRPTFTGPQPASWWLRRISHEVAMHRWDAYAASTRPEPIAAQLALDGIDEMFTVFAPSRLDFDALDAEGKTLHLHATDVDHGEWLVYLGSDSLTWEHGHAKGDVAVRGPVADLLLASWNRVPATGLEVFGDADLFTRWQGAVRF